MTNWMAAFMRVFAQKVTAEICPVQPFVRSPVLIQLDNSEHNPALGRFCFLYSLQMYQSLN